MKNVFNFYEVVRVVSKSEINLEPIDGEEGMITGMCQDEHNLEWYYAVLIYVSEEVWYINESNLVPTGRMGDKVDNSSGESIRVKVDPETGEGFVD